MHVVMTSFCAQQPQPQLPPPLLSQPQPHPEPPQANRRMIRMMIQIQLELQLLQNMMIPLSPRRKDLRDRRQRGGRSGACHPGHTMTSARST